MKQFGAWVWIILSAIIAIVLIVWFVQRISSKTNNFGEKIISAWKERVKKKQIKKELKEKKDTIINPNVDDSSTNEEFQEVIETAIAEKNEEEQELAEKEEKSEWRKDNKDTKDEKKWKEETKSGDEELTSPFDESTTLSSPNEKSLDDKEKKQLDRIILEATSLKNEWKYDEYEKRVIEWLAIDPTNLELTKMLADFYFVMWSYKKALSLLKKIVERDPEDHKSLWQIGEIYFINGDVETAELLIDKAVNLKPDSPKYNLSLVEIYYNTDRLMEAISCMEKVIKLRPTNTNYLFTLAGLYEEIGDTVNAKKNYFTILEFEPSNEKAKKKLRQFQE